MKKRIIFFPILALLLFSFQGCLLLEIKTSDDSARTAEQNVPLDVGSKINGKTIVWANKENNSWQFLAIGNPSEPMQWTNNASKFLDDSKLELQIAKGKTNTLYIKEQFNSQAHTVSNNAALYCISVGGWLPSREEAEKIIPFTNKNFWTSNAEKTSKAIYFSAEQKKFESIFRDEREKVVTIPVYYLDSKGNEVNP